MSDIALADHSSESLLKFIDETANASIARVNALADQAAGEIELLIKRMFRKKQAVKYGTLDVLLNDIDSIFSYFTFRHIPGCIPTSDRVGLKRIGVYVPHNLADLSEQVQGRDWPIGVPRPRSSIVACALTDAKHGKGAEILGDDTSSAVMRVMFAIRLKKHPLDVFAKSGRDVWSCYVGCQRKKEVEYFHFYAEHDPIIGKLDICTQRLIQPVHLKTKDGDIHFTRKLRGVEATFGQTAWGETEFLRRVFLASWLAEVFKVFSQREKQWRVSVRKGDHRVTFCIPDSSAKDYFATRDKTALTSSGKRRPIIHIAREHLRNVNGKKVIVPEHIRGLREFDWRGYRFYVSAPKFHKYTNDFSIDALVEEDVKKKVVGMNVVAREIVKYEDELQERVAA